MLASETMDKDRIAGSARDFAGKVEGAAGETKAQTTGRLREATGTAQNLYGQAKDAAGDTTDAAVNYGCELPRGGLVAASTLSKVGPAAGARLHL
jgi:uncharacterized protein YjbJ (UPF0337 family)